MIWDRLLDTAVDEQDDKPCVYGLDARQKPLGTHNPTWQQVLFPGEAQSTLPKTRPMETVWRLFMNLHFVHTIYGCRFSIFG